jgi:hypothetical protein
VAASSCPVAQICASGVLVPFFSELPWCRHDRGLGQEVAYRNASGRGREGRRRRGRSIYTVMLIIEAISPSHGTTTRAYTLSRLSRESPALHAAVIAGDMSANTAAIEAGFDRYFPNLEASGSLCVYVP